MNSAIGGRVGLAAMLIIAASAGPLFADQTAEDLLEAVKEGRAAVQAAVAGPAGAETLRLKVSNPTQQRRKLELSGVYAAAPKVAGRSPSAAYSRPTGDPPTAVALAAAVKEAVSEQSLLVGPVDGRGGFAGRQVVTLEAGQIKELQLPILRTRIERFRADPTVTYRFMRPQEWTRDAELLALAKRIGEHGACSGAAQAALWELTTGANRKSIQMVRRRDVNDDELALAEHLLAVSRDPQSEAARPLRAFVRVVNRTGEEAFNLTDEVRRIIVQGGFLGLPVTPQAVTEVKLATPSEFALALGCQWSILKAPGTANQPKPHYQSQLTFYDWTGSNFEDRNNFQVWLGEAPTPADTVTLVERGVLRHLVLVRPVLSEDEPQRVVPNRIRMINKFPYALHMATIRVAGDGLDPAAAWTLRGLAIGPGREIVLPFDGPTENLEATAVDWGD